MSMKSNLVPGPSALTTSPPHVGRNERQIDAVNAAEDFFEQNMYFSV